MPNSTTITFRGQTTGGVNDLLHDENLACVQSQNLLTFLSGALLNYEDEGRSLSPIILFCTNLEAIFQSIPGIMKYRIAEGALSPESGPRILKDCGPLTSGSWYLYIERLSDVRLCYGVFSYPLLPTMITLSELITITPEIFAVLIRKSSSNTIDICGAKGNRLSIVFSTFREKPVYDIDYIDNFSKEVYSGILAHPEGQFFRTYFRRLIERALTAAHGTILICVNSELSNIESLRDAVPIDPKLDLFEAFEEYRQSSSANAIVKLQSYEDLLLGFLGCDGIVVFDAAGAILAYHAFFRPTPVEPGPPTAVGGARRRAYEGIKHLVGSSLLSVLFRSQNGLTLHHGSTNER